MLVLGAIRLAERIINALDEKHLDDLDIGRELQQLRDLAIIADDLRNGRNGNGKKDIAHSLELVGRKSGNKSKQ